MASLKRQGNAVFLIDQIGATGVEAPMLAVGRVVITATAGREPTQDPMTGFACSDTPLGRGHIIALFLGGPDIAENYSPQYEQWQQGGAWKNMELGVRASAQQLGGADSLYMVVRLTYGRAGNNYLAEQQLFAAGQIHDWNDRRVPSRFEVWTFRASALGAAATIAALEGLPGPALVAMQNLATRPFLVPLQNFDVTQMPGEDYAFWRRNLIRRWAHARAAQALQAYRADYKTAETNQILANFVQSKTKGGGKSGGVTKPKISKAPPVVGKLSRAQTASLEIKLRTKHGFNSNLSTDAWTLTNIDDVVGDIQARLLVDTHGIRAPDIVVLNSAGAAQFVTQQLT